jgi:endonuclease/exonuclease/phosphatase family metal-dependent hydrolase
MQNMRWLILILLIVGGDCSAEQFRIVTWNLNWFPGKNPTSSDVQRVLHMSEARDALLSVQPDILCLQEVRDYDVVQKLVAVLPHFDVHIVSRFKEAMGGVLGIQQTAICGNVLAESAWSESWVRGRVGPPRGFSFSAIRAAPGTYLLVYSVHFKSNLGRLRDDIAKREEAAFQLLTHAEQMEKAYSKIGRVALVIGGDFNTSPDDSRFAEEQTFPVLRNTFWWCWEGRQFRERITIPGQGRYPDATFDGFFTKGCRVESVDVLDTGSVSDHRPVMMTISVP